MPLVNHRGSGIFKRPVAPVPIEIQSREIGHHGKVEIIIAIEVQKGGTESPSITQGRQAGLRSNIREFPPSLVA